MILIKELEIVLGDWFLSAVGGDVILESASPLAVAGGLSLGLLVLQRFIIDSSQVIVLKLHMLQLRTKYVHLTAIFEDHLVVEVLHTSFSLLHIRVFDERFPNFGFFKDEYFYYRAVGTEQLIEIVMGYDVTKLVVDAN